MCKLIGVRLAWWTLHYNVVYTSVCAHTLYIILIHNASTHHESKSA